MFPTRTSMLRPSLSSLAITELKKLVLSKRDHCLHHLTYLKTTKLTNLLKKTKAKKVYKTQLEQSVNIYRCTSFRKCYLEKHRSKTQNKFLRKCNKSNLL